MTESELKQIIVKHTVVGGYPNTVGIAKDAYALGRTHPPEVARLIEAAEAAEVTLNECRNILRAKLPSLADNVIGPVAEELAAALAAFKGTPDDQG